MTCNLNVCIVLLKRDVTFQLVATNEDSRL